MWHISKFEKEIPFHYGLIIDCPPSGLDTPKTPSEFPIMIFDRILFLLFLQLLLAMSPILFLKSKCLLLTWSLLIVCNRSGLYLPQGYL